MTPTRTPANTIAIEQEDPETKRRRWAWGTFADALVAEDEECARKGVPTRADRESSVALRAVPEVKGQ